MWANRGADTIVRESVVSCAIQALVRDKANSRTKASALRSLYRLNDLNQIALTTGEERNSEEPLALSLPCSRASTAATTVSGEIARKHSIGFE